MNEKYMTYGEVYTILVRDIEDLSKRIVSYGVELFTSADEFIELVDCGMDVNVGLWEVSTFGNQIVETDSEIVLADIYSKEYIS